MKENQVNKNTNQNKVMGIKKSNIDNDYVIKNNNRNNSSDFNNNTITDFVSGTFNHNNSTTNRETLNINPSENREEIKNNNNKIRNPTYRTFQNNNENTPTITFCSHNKFEISNPKNNVPLTTIIRNDNNFNLQSKDLSGTSKVLHKKRNEKPFQYLSDLTDTTEENNMQKLIESVSVSSYS